MFGVVCHDFTKIEWFLERPTDFPLVWFSSAKPKGVHCFLMTRDKITLLIEPNGRVHRKFYSCLPGGSRFTRHFFTKGVLCILDCIFCHDTAIFYAKDLISWNGFDLLQTTTEARLFFLSSKISDDQEYPVIKKLKSLDSKILLNKTLYCYNNFPSPIIPFVPFYPSTKQGLKEIYGRQVPMIRDGLYVIHRKHQDLRNSKNPLILTWKDAACSKFLIHTKTNEKIGFKQQTILRNQWNSVSSVENIPIILGAFKRNLTSELFSCGMNSLKIDIIDMGIKTIYETVIVINIKLKGIISHKKRSADLLGRIFFQYKARKNPVTFFGF